jgi:hypothetical protein
MKICLFTENNDENHRYIRTGAILVLKFYDRIFWDYGMTDLTKLILR